MSLRKIAGLLAAFGLVVGLIGGGVGAVFTDQATATETIQVGTFGCIISDATSGASGVGTHAVTYAAPPIMSSAAGNAPFSFTVMNNGSITSKVHVAVSAPAAPFTSILAAPVPDVTLTSGATNAYSAGLHWTALSNANLGTVASVTYTVSCLEANAATPPSTNAINTTNGWANFTAVAGSGTVALTFHQPRAFYACFEYRTDGNVPNQILAENGGVNYNLSITDGLYPYTCLNVAGSSATVTLGPTIGYVEVRMVFGAENTERFDWTRVNALP